MRNAFAYILIVCAGGRAGDGDPGGPRCPAMSRHEAVLRRRADAARAP